VSASNLAVSNRRECELRWQVLGFAGPEGLARLACCTCMATMLCLNYHVCWSKSLHAVPFVDACRHALCYLLPRLFKSTKMAGSSCPRHIPRGECGLNGCILTRQYDAFSDYGTMCDLVSMPMLSTICRHLSAHLYLVAPYQHSFPFLFLRLLY
jgi:hypothetical protein